MDYLFTFEDGSTGYLAHYGVKGMKWGKWNAETAAKYGQASANFQGGGGGMLEKKEDDASEESKSKATEIIENLLGTARQKIEEVGSHLPENPLYQLKKRTEEAEASGESDAARRRLEERYSHETVLGKSTAKQLPPSAHGIVEKPHNSESRPTNGLAAQLSTASLPSSLGQRHKATAAEKRRIEYQKESRLNRMEFNGDREGYKKAQKRTDSFYGKNGKNAQAYETLRRRRAQENAKK